MKGIKIDSNLITKKIDYSFLETKYGKPIESDFNYDYKLEELKDTDKAAKLIMKHIDMDSYIAVVTDSDCDGINSAVVLTKGLVDILSVNPKKVITIVNRRKNGNGFNKELIEEILKIDSRINIGLLIAADHGSNDNEMFKILKEKTNMELLITDHHTIKYYPTYADVFVNPLREDSTYDKSISGCCVAFMVIIKTYSLMFKTNNYNGCNELLPYVAVSIVTDCMEISLPYNRFLINRGLRVMNSSKFPFWDLLKQKLGIFKYTETDIGIKIGPLVNCGNCLNNEAIVYEMLMETDFNKLEDLINRVMELNNYRKALTIKYASRIIENFTNDTVVCEIIDIEEDALINGKVASNVGGTFNKPTVIFTEIENDVLVGSGRGIVKNLNILEIMHDINRIDSDIFLKYGGHEGAFGCNVNKPHFPKFKQLFNSLVEDKYKNIKDSDFIYPDAFIPSNAINIDLYEQQQKYAPFGINYEAPIYLSRLRLERVIPIGPICKFVFSPITYKDRIEGIYFFNDTSVTKDNVKDFLNQNVYVAYRLKMNNFRGSYTLTLEVVRMELIDG